MNRYGWRLPISIRGVIRVTGSIMCAHKTAKDLHMDYYRLSQKQVDRITQYRILRDSCIALIPKQKLLSITAAGARGGVIHASSGYTSHQSKNSFADHPPTLF